MFIGLTPSSVTKQDSSSGGAPSIDDAGSVLDITSVAPDPLWLFQDFVNYTGNLSSCRKGTNPTDVTQADIPTLTGDVIGSIRDSGSDVYHAVSPGSTEAAQKRNAVNGKSAINCDGVNDFYEITDADTAPFLDFTMAIVYKLNDPSNPRAILGDSNGDSFVLLDNLTNVLIQLQKNVMSANPSGYSSGFNVLILKSNAAGNVFNTYLNSMASATSETPNLLQDAGYFTQLFQSSFIDNYFSGEVPFICLWDQVLDLTTVTNVMAALKTQYGI